MAKDFLNEMQARGFINQCSDIEGLTAALKSGKLVAYLGADPTADSLHVGHLVPVMIMRWFQKFGNKPILLIGGATGRIGDPSDRNSDRPMLDDAAIAKNSAGLRHSYEKFIKFGDDSTDAIMVDNYDWHKKYSHIDFLREFGTSFTIPHMLSMESVKKRLEHDMSFLEFNYMPLQAVDYLHLLDEYGCRLQLCGADQWGNSVAGLSLIRRKRQQEAFVLSCPLITDSAGRKIGKSAGNAVWVNEEKTSPYEYYQYFRNIPDELVEKFLKIFTEIPLDEIAELSAVQGSELNAVKARLAFAATKIAHGYEAAKNAESAAAALFGGDGDGAAVPTKKMAMPEPVNVLDFLVQADLFPSKSEARRTLEQGGLTIDGIKITDKDFIVQPAESIMIQKGKKTFLKVVTK